MFRCCRSRVDRAIAFKRERLIICWLGCLCLLSCRGIFRLVGLDTTSGASMLSTDPPAASATARLAPIPSALTSAEQDTSATPRASMMARTAQTAASFPLSVLVKSLILIYLTFLHEAEDRFDKPTYETTNQLHPNRPIPLPVRPLPSRAQSFPPRSRR